MALEQVQKQPTQEYTGPKLTTITTPLGEQCQIHVKHSPNNIVDSIIQILNKTGYVGMLTIGQSGSGKSTWTTWLVHHLHQKRNFVVHWYSRDEVRNLYEILDNLVKGVNHILIFDDASFYLNSLKPEDLDKIESKLTHVRHDVKADVIAIFNIHYSKAIKTFFRNVPFYFLTSLSMSEFENFKEMWRHAKYKLRDYVYYYRQMMHTEGWEMVVDEWNKKVLKFTTDKPLRLGLANENGYVHFFVYHKDGCAQCDPEFEAKRIISTPDFVQNLIKSYGMINVRALLRLYLFTRKGKKVLDSKRQSLWNTVSEIDKNNKIEWDEVNTYLDTSLTKKRKRTYIKKEILEDNIKAIEEASDINKVETEKQEEFKDQVKDYIEEIKEEDKTIDFSVNDHYENRADENKNNET